jgi:hypothetical protein
MHIFASSFADEFPCTQSSFSVFNHNWKIMRKLFLLFGMIAVVSFLACSKSSTTPSDSSTTLKFENLVANDTVMKVNDITTITATASGDGLAYNWTASYGTFIGSGSKVQWTVCHSDRFSITCVVKDKNNKSESRTIYIRTVE